MTPPTLRTPLHRRALLLGATLVVLQASACAPAEDAADDTIAAAVNDATAERTATIEGFSTPESVKYDEEQDVYFVSNINGNPSQKDGNGFISRVEPDSMLVDTMFIAGGAGGVVLNAPKGLAITGDTLWVTDIDVVRGFNRETGAPVGVISFESHDPRFLNDIATGPDGALFVTDMGVLFAEDGSMTSPGPERIFR
ncbi:MAG: hypothetical protein ACRENI_12770, partial [Gemmatimonadaceae bacterium]